MGLGSAHQTVTTGANFIPEIWSKEVQRATEANLVAAKLVKRFDSEVSNKGDVLHIPKISNLTATAKSASTAVTFSSPTEDKVDLTVGSHYHIGFIIEDILDAQSAYRLAEEYKQKASYGLAKQVDTDILALYTGLSQSVGSAGVPPTDGNVLRAIQYLDDADAPMTERSFVMAPSLKSTLLQIDRYVDTDFVGDQPVKTGLFGQRYGLNFHVSTNVPTSSSNPINLIMHKEAFACAMQKNVTMKSDYIIEYLGQAYVFQVLYGVAEYRDAFGVQLLS
jgi:hypothetical protein